jgi:hypothetical protein
MKKFLLIIFILFLPTFVLSEQSSNYPFMQNAFNPDISLIIDFSIAKNNIEEHYLHSLQIPGLLDHLHNEGKTNGFNFNYLELSFFAPVDPYFELFAVVSYEHNELEVEEAYVNTLTLPYGLNARIGKFLSAFGRLNEQHKHYWSFFDAPLIYETLLGPHGVSDVGGRLYWTAPTNFYLTIGTEIFQGSLEHNPSFNNQEIEISSTIDIKSASKPSLFNIFAKTSLDYNKHIFLFGTSFLYGATRLQNNEDEEHEGLNDVPHIIVADGTKIFNLEFTYKFIKDSYRSITIESEFMKRYLNGNLYELIQDNNINISTLNKYTTGLYSQIIWRFDKHGRWRTGFRYDLIFQNDTKINASKADLPSSLSKYTAMLEYNPTEFSRIRLQYSYDKSKYIENELKPNHILMLQFNFSIGAHGAHKF